MRPVFLLLAQDLTCAELQQVATSGVPAEGLVGLIETRGMPATELACVQDSALPEEVKAAAKRSAQAAPVIPTGAARPTFQRPEVWSMDPGLRRWLAVDPCSPIQLARDTPDPGVAMVLSGIIGFGSGHFYAGKPGMGAAMLLTQLGAGALATAGSVRASNGHLDGSLGLAIGGGVGLTFLHLFDFATAHGSAVATRDDAYRACGW